MLGAAILWIGLVSAGSGEFLRPFGAKEFDQATLDAEGFGDKKSLAREDDGLKVTLAQGQPEAGWKTPATLRIGGDFTITANLVVRKLPKAGQEDGAAIGLAIATQNLDSPETTLLREIEPDGKDVYRAVEKSAGGPRQPQNPFEFNPFGNVPQPNKPLKPIRHTFPAKGSTIRLVARRQGSILRYQVTDEMASLPREVGQVNLGPGDIAGVKLFASNRSGTEPVEISIRDVTVHADRISGLGTAVRTVFGKVVHGEPTGIEGHSLVVGGPPPTPPPAANPAPAAQPAAGPAPAAETAKAAAPAPAPAPAAVAPAGVQVAVAPVAPSPGNPVEPAAAALNPAAPQAAQPVPAAAAPAPAAKPKALIRLDEVESIAFERSSALAARYIGQPNVDATGPVGTPVKDEKEAKKPPTGDDLAAPPPGTAAVVKIPKVDPKPNGIRDLHLSLSGIREAAIQQVMIQCQTDKGQSSWRLDTTGSTDWPLTVSRSGSEGWADLFLEPPAGDCHDKEFNITVTYADGQNGMTKVKATGHTDPKLAFDPESPTPALDARVYLAGDEQLFGKLEAISEEALTLTTPWGDRLDVPLTRVVGVYMGMPDHKESAESFAKRLKVRGDQDLLLARTKDSEIVAIGGIVEGAKANKLTFLYNEKSRTLALKMVEGLVLAARPAPKPPTDVRPTFALNGGIAISGRWTAIEANDWKIETPWGQPLKLPAAEVRTVRFQGGQMTYLSDLEPSQVEETPYFGRKVPYRKDVNPTGGPLKLDDRVVDKGLAVHSRTVLTYDLERRYEKFEALVGFDASGKKKGRVDCRVFADDKEIYANPDLRADAPPVPLSLPVSGAEQIRLVIDFGPDEDTGDRVIWANARLYRQPPSATKPASGP